MFMVDEETAAAIRSAWDKGGELSAVARLRAQAHDVELRRHFPFISDGETARRCVRTIVGWTQGPAPDRDAG